MYVETAQKSEAATVKITTATGTTYSRIWRIKVTFVECYSLMRAPTDCSQYFTGVSGTIQSPNYQGSNSHRVSRNQEVTYCFRQEEGYTAIDFSVPDSGSDPDYYDVTGNENNANRSPGSCNKIFLQLLLDNQWDLDNSVYFCGGQFSSHGGATTSSSVRSNALPFNVRFVVINAATPDESNIGFKINWRQVPASS